MLLEALQSAKEALRSGLKKVEESQGVGAFSAAETRRKSARNPPLTVRGPPGVKQPTQSRKTESKLRVETMSENLVSVKIVRFSLGLF